MRLSELINQITDHIAGNDGLSLEDWKARFSDPRYDGSQPMAITHFTSFRYCK